MIFSLKTYTEQELHSTLRLCYEIKVYQELVNEKLQSWHSLVVS